MDSHDRHNTNSMGMPRSNLMQTMEDASAMTVFVAQAVAAVITLGQIIMLAVFIPVLLSAYVERGIELTGIALTLDWLQWYGMLAVIIVGNGVIFWGCERLARRYWIGIAFVPPMIYIFGTLALFMGAVASLL